ncbi:TPA: N-acetylneuraminate synthase [Patescibacteria group bacterium]|nr:MAG: N-acetylneuraminate synthase [Parcubacteria group bacterium GW2011_GWF2_40_10]KKR58903.1 MAG: N-acetylneuraminate synthase [Parcubacteria group bacterium GW2011_GWC2_40_31]KKR75416.1 MAG: N-acetylneuraminate synthase [Parcubacteria group bacterium GW2011_GWB2_40_8]KKR81069.1 MAG: N-acetylneuraminate synthase [Parcubacteria group bacterium GW2011_GWD2_40_9]HCI04367.1 N-acetylneuraminate synthase [Patescibacteria group bacterium]
MDSVRIGDFLVGSDHPCFIIAEIGINHNGDIEIAKRLIDTAVFAGCNAVKFQKRMIDVVYSQEELSKPRENPFGLTNGDLKRGLEFGQKEYEEIDRYCREKDIIWFASCWDESSVDFIDSFNPPCYKIASASLTDEELLRYHRKKGKPIILSTGMSDLPMIKNAVKVLGRDDLIIMHCTSTYPSKSEELNLQCIKTLKREFKGVPIGYSGHEAGLATTIAAAVLGACIVERHITIDRSMWGSDQAASVEPQGMRILVQNIREIEKAIGDGIIKIYESEIPIMGKLRRKK